ncbi:uncharacterized protein EDB91DRAFT_1284911 [Suillus paluster]|uniref:uncharacterized protein n=1 Tax=Suillus paluster TaxID=48578 RepID=UPI001B863C34|nr:uncharacterized protein EDB91DRAFT_1284911 [Suillus paluster]KAG1739107.1 hypothetical protein EDB91DRAFT_1284911 [Suillus paluster]
MFRNCCAPGPGHFLGQLSSVGFRRLPSPTKVDHRFAIVRASSTSTSPTPGAHSLEGFSAIGTGVYLQDIREKCQDTTSPNVILIFGWMGGQLRHLQHYTRAYAKLYPNASQIIVQCNSDLFWTTNRARKRSLKPVIDALEALHCLPSSSSPQRSPRILTHAFSNGGCLQMTLLGHMLQQKYGSTSLPESFTSALILDSCPAVGNLESIKRAVCTVVQNPIVRLIVLAIVHTKHSVCFGLSLLFDKRMIMLENLQIEMWNPRILSWMGLHTPRLYLFSPKDKLVSWQEVMRHAETAKERGMVVCCELFEKSEHVAHARVEPKRYWTAVQEVWAVATKEKGEGQRISN